MTSALINDEDFTDEDAQSDLRSSVTIQDKGNVAYIIHVLFGIGTLLPWNVVLSCLDFLIAKVRTYWFTVLRCRAKARRPFTLSPATSSFLAPRSGWRCRAASIL